jgi:hypothetical protein
MGLRVRGRGGMKIVSLGSIRRVESYLSPLAQSLSCAFLEHALVVGNAIFAVNEAVIPSISFCSVLVE